MFRREFGASFRAVVPLDVILKANRVYSIADELSSPISGGPKSPIDADGPASHRAGNLSATAATSASRAGSSPATSIRKKPLPGGPP